MKDRFLHDKFKNNSGEKKILICAALTILLLTSYCFSVYARPPRRLYHPDIHGYYYHEGICKVIQSRTANLLKFINENGEESIGKFHNAYTIVATNWKNQKGEALNGSIKRNPFRIEWEDGTVWIRSR